MYAWFSGKLRCLCKSVLRRLICHSFSIKTVCKLLWFLKSMVLFKSECWPEYSKKSQAMTKAMPEIDNWIVDPSSYLHSLKYSSIGKLIVSH